LIEERSGPLIVQEEFQHFGNRENGGEKSFNFAIREIPIHKIATRSGPLDPEEREPSDLGAPKYRHFGSRGCEGSCDWEVASREIPIRERRISTIDREEEYGPLICRGEDIGISGIERSEERSLSTS
jgi:hypothetical protein